MAAIAMGARHLIQVATASTSNVIPVTKVKRGRVAVMRWMNESLGESTAVAT